MHQGRQQCNGTITQQYSQQQQSAWCYQVSGGCCERVHLTGAMAVISVPPAADDHQLCWQWLVMQQTRTLHWNDGKAHGLPTQG